MWYLPTIVTVLCSATAHGNNLLQECAKYYRPKNYLDMLPNIAMPYVDQVPIPNNMQNLGNNKEYMNKMKNIVPTKVMTTKVLTVKTKYVYKNPVCVKYTKKQKLCKPEDGRIRQNVDKLITKEHFTRNNVEERVESMVDVMPDDASDLEDDRFSLKVSFDKLEPSEADDTEESRAFGSALKRHTPSILPEKIGELLIEDRLDQLETILPEYRRRRVYETSTMYVTKTISNQRSMATLVAKNCVPMGYEVCSKKTKTRKSSKAARRTFDPDESQFYFG